MPGNEGPRRGKEVLIGFQALGVAGVPSADTENVGRSRGDFGGWRVRGEKMVSLVI